MKKTMKKLLGGGTAVVLSLAMALGVFTGMGMEVRAGEKWSIEAYTLPANFQEVERSCVTIEETEWNAEVQAVVTAFINTNPTGAVLLKVEGQTPADNVSVFCKGEYGMTLERQDCDLTGLQTAKRIGYFLYILKKNTVSAAPGSTSSRTASTGTSQKSGSDTPSYVHTHSYSWVTVQEAGTEQDGIEEYRCSCGDVQERNVIPASEVLVKGLFGEIKDAPLNGSTAFDTGRQYTLSDHIIRKLAERTDVTTVITFEYEGQPYRMTIPAGADYSQLLADEDYFYGYFYFASAVGAVIEAL